VNPVKLFEDEFRKVVGCKHAVAVCNGSAALHVAFLTAKIRYWRQVIMPPFTFIATANAATQSGTSPLFVDIEPNTLALNPEKVEEALKTCLSVGAVVVVHLFGRSAKVRRIKKICDYYGVPLIEDASQAFGVWNNGKHVGIFGDVGIFSFYYTKNLWTYEGGMLVTDDDGIAEQARMIRNHGRNEDGEMVISGYNYRMPWPCAFQGWQMLKHHRKAVLAEARAYGPEDGYYPKLVYQHKYYREHPALWTKLDCPVAEETARRISLGWSSNTHPNS